MTPLQRALALPEVNQVSVLVTQNLDLDVPRPFQVLLHVERRIAEGVLRLRLGVAPSSVQLLLGTNHAHALAAPAGHRLQQHRITPFLRPPLHLLGRRQGCGRPRHDWRPGALRRVPRLSLVSHQLHRFRRRPDEDHPGVVAGPRQPRVLRQEAVTWVQRLGAALPRHVHQFVDVQVTLGRGRRADPVSLVGHQHVLGGAVHLRVDRHRADPHLADNKELVE
jgi:hypothetical protein